MRLLRFDPALEGEDGRGTRIALLDRGLCWEHRVFRGAAIRARDFTGKGELTDPTGHGTANSSLLVGQREEGFEGLAPCAELLFAQVLGASDRETTVRAVVRGIRWALEHGAHVIVLPFGTRRGSTRIARAVARAVRAGATVLGAAGNRGSEELCFPAWLDEVVAVTGVDAAGRALSDCCSPERADLAAPGEDVPAIGPGGPATLRGSSPAVVLAAGVEVLRRAAGRAMTPWHRPTVVGPQATLALSCSGPELAWCGEGP